MTPETFAFIKEFGLPLVIAVVLAIVYYRSQAEVVKDLRNQRDTAHARADALIEGMRAGTAATTALTEIVREGFRREAK